MSVVPMPKLYVSSDAKNFQELSGLVVGSQIAALQKIKIKVAIRQYIKMCTAKKCKANHKREKTYLKNLHRFFVSNRILTLDRIQRVHIDEFEVISGLDIKKSSLARRFVVYIHFFKKCVEWGYLHESPMKGYKLPQAELNPYKKWTPEDFYKFIETCDGQMKQFFTFLWYTGARPKEAAHLKLTDIVYTNMKPKKGEPVGMMTFQCGKNSKRKVRKFPIMYYTDKLLHNVRSRGIYVFAYNGEQINTDRAYQYAKHRLIRIGLGHLTPYGIRHGFAGRCEDSGMPLSHIKNRLGHVDVRTTMRYLNPDENEMFESLARVDF